MPLHLTKIAFGAQSVEALTEWLESHASEALMTTRYLPKRHEEMLGGSLYWIHEHALIGRSPLLGFEQRSDGRWHIRLKPHLIRVQTTPRRAHQGWRYLDETDAPPDLDGLDGGNEAMPARLVSELSKLGLA